MLFTSFFRTLANYLFWRIASPLAHFGPENLRNEFFNFHKVYYGTTAKSPRWKTCMAIAEGWMKFALGKVYVDHKFNSKAKRIVSIICK